MSLFIDLAILAILILCVFFGYKKGLIGVIFKLFSFILSLVLSFILITPITNLVIEKTSIDEKIQSSVINIINNNDESEKPSTVTNYIDNYVSEFKSESLESIAKNISEKITRTILTICTFIVLFIVLRIVFFFLGFITNSIAELPIIKQFNISGGIAYGFIEALFIIYFVFAIISFINVPSLQAQINNSIIGSFLYNKNLILMFLF